jgi:phenylacetate-CoA ligase
MENNYVEILCNGYPAKPGEVGDIIVTNLNNQGMPFIRYSIGDAGAWYLGEDCSCGRVSPMLQAIEGRIVDSFKTGDGRIVWAGFAGAAFHCLDHPAIRQFQVVQKSVDNIVVRLVPDGEIPQSVLNEITHAIQVIFGLNVKVNFEFPDTIPPLPSGKHRYAVSELN